MSINSINGFCGGSPFLDVDLLWNHSYPQFTDCFQNTVLILVPCIVLWLFSPFFFLYIRGVNRPETHVSKFHLAKNFLVGLLATVSVTESVRAIVHHNTYDETNAQADVLSPFLRAITLVYVMVIMRYQRKRGLVSTILLAVFWFLELIASIIPFYTKIMEKEYDTDLFKFILFYIDCAFVLALFIMSCFAEIAPGDPLAEKRPCPETLASSVSQLTFAWMTRIIFKGYSKALIEDDLWDLSPENKAGSIVPRLDGNWTEKTIMVEQKRATSQKEENVARFYHTISGSMTETKKKKSNIGKTDETKPLLGNDKGSDTDSGEKILEPKQQVSIVVTILKTFWWEIFVAHFCEFLYCIVEFMFPLLLQVLINHTTNLSEQSWKGYLYSAGVVCVSVTQSLCNHQSMYRSCRVGMRIRTAIIAAIYRKALTVTPLSRKESTVGEIVNLMSVDSQNFLDFLQYSWALWSGPLQLVIAVIFLYFEIGWSVFAGLAIVIILFPVNGIILTKMSVLQETQMEFKDQRIKLINEILNGIKVLKLYTWELSFKEKVNVIRKNELSCIRKIYLLLAFIIFSWTVTPFLISLISFAVYILTTPDHYLSPDKAFVSISLFGILRFAINIIPDVFSNLIRVRISTKRINKFLSHDDIDLNNVIHDANQDAAVKISNGNFQWDPEIGPCLKNINITVPDGSLIAVVGQVGSGKSSLISAILGETVRLSGSVGVKGSVAYVSQEAWIQNATLRDNIFFGKEHVDSTYQTLLDACALRPDLAILSGGDMTEIGEKGINLSGGQKQRVSLARAVYNDADIYLLDDPLSAVDAHVGKHIFDKVICTDGLLKKKTRILVTHGVHWLPKVDKIIVLVNGAVSETGSYDELMSHDGPFAQFLRTYLTEHDEQEDQSKGPVDEEAYAVREKMLTRLMSVQTESATSGDEVDSPQRLKRMKSVSSAADGTDKDSAHEASTKLTDNHGPRRRRPFSRHASRTEAPNPRQRKVSMADIPRDLLQSFSKSLDQRSRKSITTLNDNDDKLIGEETAGTGKVSWEVYMVYIKAIGLLPAAGIVFCFAAYQAMTVVANYWLQMWTDDAQLSNLTALPGNSTERGALNDEYLGIYGLWGVLQSLFIFAFSFAIAIRMYVASFKLHAGMLDNIMRCPMSFFDTTPIGRIVNRFSKDTDSVDEQLPNVFIMWFVPFFSLISTIIVVGTSTPIFLAIIAPLMVFYFFVQRFYIATSRQIRRLEARNRSPVFNHFSETLTGASVIRAYRQQSRFIRESEAKIDTNQVFYITGQAANRWLGVFLDVTGALAVMAAALLAVSERGTISGGIMGLSISYAFQITSSLTWVVQSTSELETNIVSVERMKEYTDLPNEAPWYLPGFRPPSTWPDKGVISFDTYSTRYRAGLNLVIRGITASITSGEKVGIVGRTGAGKSSLTLALFRLIEAAGGAITIDDQNIAQIGLHDLRKKLTILPQDPVLFSGSLRMNLDPFDTYTDIEIWRALDNAHLKTYVEGLPETIHHDCGEGGSNLSVGQRQLLCLARSLLRKTKILILDEATAAVDMETDDLIQQTIREEFKDCTIMTIAHRLNTIMDYDRVMVLDNGLISEFDSPSNLLQDKNGIFYGMAKNAGLAS